MPAGHGQESTSRGWSKVLEGEFPSGIPVACDYARCVGKYGLDTKTARSSIPVLIDLEYIDR